MKHEMLVHHDARGVASVGHLPRHVLVRAVVREYEVIAELFEAVFAIRARPVRVHHAADRAQVAQFKLFHVAADLRHAPQNLVPRHHGIHGASPLVAHRVQIRMANAAKKYLNLHVARPHLAPLELPRPQRTLRASRRISLHHISLRARPRCARPCRSCSRRPCSRRLTHSSPPEFRIDDLDQSRHPEANAVVLGRLLLSRPDCF